ncbi:MAG: hypothetical protein FWF24_05955 [Alphaproteobacteria bacterium]|nr:hypothetical protein [Alphaproteobacteria bacterium]
MLRDFAHYQFPPLIALVCRDDLPYPNKLANELTDQEWLARKNAVLDQLPSRDRIYWEKSYSFIWACYAQQIERGASLSLTEHGRPPGSVVHKTLKNLEDFSGQPFAHYAQHEFKRISSSIVFYGVAPETPETYKHKGLPSALKPERAIVSDRDHLTLLHELAHTIFSFSDKAREKDNIYYAYEMLPDLYAIMRHRQRGGQKEVVQDFIDMRALMAFATSGFSSYFTAPICEAFLKRKPIPSYKQVLTAYRELQMRSLGAGMFANSYHMNCSELCAKMKNVVVDKNGQSSLQKAATFMKHRRGTFGLLQGPYGMAILYHIVANCARLDPFTRDVGEGVLKAFDSFCPRKAAEARRMAGVADDFCVRAAALYRRDCRVRPEGLPRNDI